MRAQKRGARARDRRRLEEEAELAEAAMARARETAAATITPRRDVSDVTDLASHASIVAVAAGLASRAHETARKVADAVAATENGTYGKCQDCQKVIPNKRLKALGYAICCIVCQEEREGRRPARRNRREGRPFPL